MIILTARAVRLAQHVLWAAVLPMGERKKAVNDLSCQHGTTAECKIGLEPQKRALHKARSN